MMHREGILPRPRTLRGRKQIADAFGRAASEIQSLGSKLKSALTIQGPSVSIGRRLTQGSASGRPSNSLKRD